MISRAEQAQLVAAWDAADDATMQPRVRQMIHAEIQRIHRAFAKLPIRVSFVDHDPYRSFEEMRDQVQSTGQMLVWKGASDTPLWDPKTNWMARAVHDWDHIVKSCDFSMEGEAMAYRSSAACTPGLAPLYLSEIMLQAAIANFTGAFVPQKLVIAPEDIQKKALRMRGVPPADQHKELVWLIAGVLRTGSPQSAMIHLREFGVPREEALVIVDAAKMVNARADGAQHERAGLGGLQGQRLQLGPGVPDARISEILRKSKKLPKKYDPRSLDGAIYSAAAYAIAFQQTMFVYEGNSYMNRVFRVSNDPSNYLNAINNTGSRMFSVTPDLTVARHDVLR